MAGIGWLGGFLAGQLYDGIENGSFERMAETGYSDFESGLGVIGGYAQSAWQDFENGLGVIGGDAQSAWQDFENGLGVIGGDAQSAWQDFENGLGVIGSDAHSAWQDFENGVGVIGNAVQSGFQDFENGLGDLGSDAQTAWQNFENGLGVIGNDLQSSLQDFENGLSNISNGLNNAINGMLDGLLGLPSDFLKGLEWLFGARHDPLVIDLTGSGINIEDSSNPLAPYFKFSSGNFATKTSWIGSGNAFLVIQSTNSAYGVSIGDGYELLGTGSKSGFDVLKALDSNGDGQINASDPAYASLAVWEDGNGNGVFNSAAVVSLADAGISSISMNTSGANTAIGGSTITQTSTVTFANGTSNEIAQVDLGYNPDQTIYTGSYTETTQIAELPNIRGYGNVANLDIAMSLDPTLTNLVQNLVSDTPESVAGFDLAIQAIMYEWVGVEAVSPSSGNIFDGQKVDFLANYTPYTSAFATNGTPPWFIGQAIAMNGAWNSDFDAIEAQFLVQLPNTALATNFTYLPLAGDIILPDTYDLGASIEQIATDAPSVSTDGLTYWLRALLIDPSRTMTDDDIIIITGDVWRCYHWFSILLLLNVMAAPSKA